MIRQSFNKEFQNATSLKDIKAFRSKAIWVRKKEIKKELAVDFTFLNLILFDFINIL